MTSRRRAAAALATVVLAATAGWVVSRPSAPRSTPPTAAPATLVGGFDSSDLSSDSWLVLPAGSRSVSVTDDQPYSGRGALVVDTRENGNAVTVSRHQLAVSAGRRYDVAAFALSLSGRQKLVLAFADSTGTQVGQTSVGTPAPGAWSRVAAHGTAPPTAATATIRIVADGADSLVRWDEVRLLSADVPNGGFERIRHGEVPGWSVSAAATTRVEPSSDAHTGGTSLQVSGRPARSSVATSARVQVFPDVVHHFNAWVRPIEGDPELTVDWFDSDGQPIRSTTHAVRAPTDEWTRVTYDDPAPSTAASAAVSIGTADSAGSVSRWDDVTVVPATPQAPPALVSQTVAHLDGFMTTTTSDVITVAGRPQLVTIVSGEPATFQVADLQTGELVHVAELPGLTNGWALTKAADGLSVYVGGGTGHVWRYDATTRSMTDLGKATPDATLIWDLETDSDGRVWGASYPLAELWSYDPATRQFTSRGRVDQKAAYARGLAVDDAHVFIGTGPKNPHIVMVPRRGTGAPVVIPPPKPIANGFVKQLDRRGRFLFARFTSDVYGLYDLQSRSWVKLSGPADVAVGQVPSAAPPGAPFYYIRHGKIWKVAGSGLTSGTVTPVATSSIPQGRNSAVVPTTIGNVRGAWLVTHDGGFVVSAVNLSALPARAPGAPLPEAVHRTFTLKLKPSSLHIKSLAAGDDGLIYVGGFGGPSFVAFTESGEVVVRYPSPDDQSPRVIGEIEGMIANGPSLYLGSYTGARILRYDTRKPWDNLENPTQIGSLGPSFRQDRPQAWAVDGRRTYFGTVPTYGALGGALGWIDGSDATPLSVRSPITDQSVVSIAGRKGIAYVGTSRWGGLGSTPSTPTASVFAYDTSRKKVLWTSKPVARAQAVGALTITANGSLWGVSGGTLFELDLDTGKRIRQLRLTTAPQPKSVTWSVAQIAEYDGSLYVAVRGALYSVDPDALSVTTVQASGVAPNKVIVQDGALYYPVGSALRRAIPRPHDRASSAAH